MNICPKCGIHNEDKTDYCTKCGTPLTASAKYALYQVQSVQETQLNRNTEGMKKHK